MRKIKRRMAVLTAKIKDLEVMLMQNFAGQPVALWLKIRDALALADAQLSELRKNTTHKYFSSINYKNGNTTAGK